MTLDQLLTKWLDREGGAERANYQMFLSELAQALDLPAPDPKGHGLGDYEFEAPVRSEAVLGTKGTGRIDLYKRDCFVLEAKQSQVKPGEALPLDPPAPPPKPIFDLFDNPIGLEQSTGKPPPRYDRLMADARLQAERYARALPGDHKSPPFLIVADIGRSFELYFDYTGNGRGYGAFPDERSYRIGLAELTGDRVIPGLDLTPAQTLRAIWTDPASIDPRLRAAEVTRDIAVRLSRVAEALEKDQRQLRPGDAEIALGIEATSLFLMRMLFCMFAEDVELLPKDSFKQFLGEAKDKSDLFWRNGLTDLWSKMNSRDEVNRFWLAGDAIVRYFNGNLFSDTQIFNLPREFKAELHVAAGKDWRKVEPAIFGTLLEQVLTAKDRAKLGAHYTPRAYVERLVDATMMEVLRPEWEGILGAARAKVDAGDVAGAMADATAFHTRLTALRVLDPACGTGNFLYVAMEQLLRLETEVRQFVIGLGGALDPAVHPNQFLGLELNPRAAVIAELVLWIGWLRYRLANTPEAIGEPVLPTLDNINMGTHGGYDAVLAMTAQGVADLENPRRPVWPEADFIIGNPPFIGGKDVRARLDADQPGYAEALWRANPNVPPSADFVMQWWDRAADILTRPGTRLKRFGLVTTNSITQVFSRRVIERYLAKSFPSSLGEGDHAQHGGGAVDLADGDTPPPIPNAANAPPLHPQPAAGAVALASPRLAKTASGGRSLAPAPPPRDKLGEDQANKLHLTLAIADHPWTRVGKDAAAVRIAMTVAQRNDASGAGEGRLVTITGERALNTDAPELEEREARGAINSDLSVGADVTRVTKLLANLGICHDGVKLHGKGFSITWQVAKLLGLGSRDGLELYIRPYRNGMDLAGRTQVAVANKYVIDLFGVSEKEVRDRFPELYQHLLKSVKPERDTNRRQTYRKNWWIFGEPRRELRPALDGLVQYIVTVDTAKHRVFQLLDSTVICDDKSVIVADEDVYILGVLSSQIHVGWADSSGGWLGVGNDSVYVKSKVFDPYPFPNPTAGQRSGVANIAKDLDTTRRTALSENPQLTMTGLYNLVADVRAGVTLTPAREAEVVKARARIVAKLHDDLDAAVAAAYGWEWPLPPGEIVARLVALNATRAAEEAAGTVRWLRPDYQIPRFAKEAVKGDPPGP